MIGVSDSITVDVPRERVYEFLDDPHNHAEITPSRSSAGTTSGSSGRRWRT